MKVVVVGGTQFIGRRIVEHLIEQGHQPLVVHRGEHEPESLESCEHLHVDRRDFARISDDVRSFQPDAVVDTYAMSLATTMSVLPHLPDVPRVVLSSMDVYAAYDAFRGHEETHAVPLSEDARLRTTRFPYRGLAGMDGFEDYEKIDVERAYLEAKGTVLRLAVIYGEHDPQRREEFVLRRVRAQRTYIPIGAATWLWSRCYVGDVATAVERAISSSDAAGEIFNIGNQSIRSMRGWIKEILSAANFSAELIEVEESLVPDDLSLTRSQRQHWLIDSSKARSVLGWESSPSEETVRRSVEWHLANAPESLAGKESFAADDLAWDRRPERK